MPRRSYNQHTTSQLLVTRATLIRQRRDTALINSQQFDNTKVDEFSELDSPAENAEHKIEHEE